MGKRNDCDAPTAHSSPTPSCSVTPCISVQPLSRLCWFSSTSGFPCLPELHSPLPNKQLANKYIAGPRQKCLQRCMFFTEL